MGSIFGTPKWGPFFGSKNQPLFGQAVAFYRWINAVLCACKKPCLIVNMDEASLTYELTGIVGTVLKRRPSMGWEPGQRVRLGDRRGNVTYIASISNDEEVNKILPQILLGNSHRFLKRLLQDAEAAVGDMVVIWRENSAWNNHYLMQKYIHLLCGHLREYLGHREVILLMDMAPCHMHPSVFALARRKGIRIVLIPAGLTGLLQPLDTHVFRQFRARMQHWWLESKSSASDGAVSLLAWLGLVRRSIDEIVLGKDWHHAFEHTGVLSGQVNMSSKSLKAFGWESPPCVGDGLPGLGQAAAMFPRRSSANVEAWVHWRPAPKYAPIQTLD